MKFEVFKFEKVTSTNDTAIKLIREKNKMVGCVYSKTQTRGRGTNGKNGCQTKAIFLSRYFFL